MTLELPPNLFSSPADPKPGQLWYDIKTDNTKVWNGTAWFTAWAGPLEDPEYGSGGPMLEVNGDLWIRIEDDGPSFDSKGHLPPEPHPHDPKSIRERMHREAGKIEYVSDGDALEWAFPRISRQATRNYQQQKLIRGLTARLEAAGLCSEKCPCPCENPCDKCRTPDSERSTDA